MPIADEILAVLSLARGRSGAGKALEHSLGAGSRQPARSYSERGEGPRTLGDHPYFHIIAAAKTAKDALSITYIGLQ